VFDDILESDVNISDIEKKPEQSSNSGYKNFQKKKDEVQDAYVPIAIYVDRDFPDEIKEKFYTVISKLVAKKYTVRINGDDKEFANKVKSLSDKFIEIYIPWKGFNDIETKHYFNQLTAKHIAQSNFIAWDKIPDPVKSMLARNVRMIFGDKNNSIALCVITWSPDGASKYSEVTKETGRASFVITVASKYSFPVLNIQKPNAGTILERTFNL
jgi:hypothetical protein